MPQHLDHLGVRVAPALVAAFPRLADEVKVMLTGETWIETRPIALALAAVAGGAIPVVEMFAEIELAAGPLAVARRRRQGGEV